MYGKLRANTDECKEKLAAFSKGSSVGLMPSIVVLDSWFGECAMVMQDKQAFVKKLGKVYIRTTIFVTLYSHHIPSEENA